MMITTKLLRFALPAAVVGIGIGGAVLLGGAREKKTATIPAGALLVATLDQTVSTDRSGIGDHITLHTTDPIRLGNETEIPDDATIHGEVTHVKGGGRIAGAPELTLRFTELELDGHTYPISADPLRVTGKSDVKESAAEIGGGTIAGAVLGGVKGAIVGAALGTGVAVATAGDQLTLPAGQKLRVRLTQPITVQYRPRAEKVD